MTGGEAFRAFGEYVEEERAKTGRIARHLSPARRAEVLAAFDLPDQRFELFEKWMTITSGLPVHQSELPSPDGLSSVSAA